MSKVDIEFKKKLEMSYQKCLEELTEIENWKSIIKENKYQIDDRTGLIKTSVDIPLNFDEEILIENVHNYVFNRSHFYKKSSRLKHELESVWNKRGYYVRLWQDESTEKWYLHLGWNWNN